jgi:hypothetical protein
MAFEIPPLVRPEIELTRSLHPIVAKSGRGKSPCGRPYNIHEIETIASYRLDTGVRLGVGSLDQVHALIVNVPILIGTIPEHYLDPMNHR